MNTGMDMNDQRPIHISISNIIISFLKRGKLLFPRLASGRPVFDIQGEAVDKGRSDMFICAEGYGEDGNLQAPSSPG